MQLVDQKTMFLIGFTMFFERKTLKTLILDTCVQPLMKNVMVFAPFCVLVFIFPIHLQHTRTLTLYTYTIHLHYTLTI